MTLQEAIDHTWEVYQQKTLEEAWAKLEDANNCHECAEEHRQLHEWLSKLKRVAHVVNEYENGVYSSVEPAVLALDIIRDILEEGDGI